MLSRWSIASTIVASSFLVGCGESTASEPDAAEVEPDAGSVPEPDSGVCATPERPIDLPACAEVPTRTGEPGGRGSLAAGDANVVAIETVDGRTHVTLGQEDVERVVVLPVAPALLEGDTVAVEVDGGTVTISREGVFVAFAGGLVRHGDFSGALNDTIDTGAALVLLGDVEVQAEPICASSRPHHDPRFCPDVGLVSFGLRFGETLVAPGESVELTVGDRSLAVAIESITLRDDRYSDSCEAPCGDYWYPSFDVALVPLPAPPAP